MGSPSRLLFVYLYILQCTVVMTVLLLTFSHEKLILLISTAETPMPTGLGSNFGPSYRPSITSFP